MPYDPAGQPPPRRRLTVACFAPALGSGGADRVVITLLSILDRARFQPVLPLLRRVGASDAGRPARVAVEVLGGRPVRLAILGDGPLRGSILELVRGLGLTDDVVFLGFDKNPFRYMARAALLLHASLAEGSPGALIQTLVMSTDCDHGPREVIRPGDDGLLVPVGDQRTLAASVLDLLESPERRRLMALAARHSSLRYTVSRVVSVYEDAVAGGTTP